MIKIFVNISAVNIEDNIRIDSVTANPFIGPMANMLSKNAADIETKSAISSVFQASTTAIFAAN